MNWLETIMWVIGLLFGAFVFFGFILGTPRIMGSSAEALFVFRRLSPSEPLTKVIRGKGGGNLYWSPFVLERTQRWYGSVEAYYQDTFDIGETQLVFTLFCTVWADEIPFRMVHKHGYAWPEKTIEHGVWYFNLDQRLENMIKSMDQLVDRALISSIVQEAIDQANTTRLDQFGIRVKANRWECSTTLQGEVAQDFIESKVASSDTSQQATS